MVIFMKMQSELELSQDSLLADRELKSNKILARFPWKIFSVVFAIAYLIILATLGDTDPFAVLTYFLGQIVFVLIPGMAMGAHFSISTDKVKFICLSYFLGIFISLVCYVIVYLLHLQDYLLYVLAAVSALSFFILYKKRTFYAALNTNNAGGAVLSIVTAVLLMMILSYTIFNNFTPDYTPNTVYYHDMLFNTGNITALYLDFPPQDIRNLDFSFNYNYLYCMFLAIFKNIFGISSFDLNFKLFSVTQILLFTSSLYILFQKYIKNMLLVGAAILLTLLADEFIFAHVMWAAFSTSFGLVLCMLSIYFFLKYTDNIDTAKIRDKNFWMALLFFGMTSFAKSPFALVLLAGLGAVLIYQLFRKKNPKTLLAHGLIAIAVIGVSFLVIMWGVAGYNGFTKGFATIMTTMSPSYYVDAVNSLGASLSPFLIKLLTYPVFLSLYYTTVVISFVLLVYGIIKWRREDIKKEIFLLASVVTGIVCASVITQPGLSNILFMMIEIPISLLAITMVLRRVCLNDARKIFKRVLVIVICALVALHTGFSIRSIKLADQTTVKSYPLASLTDSPVLNTTPNANCISHDEYLGMLWIKENTPKDAIIAGDRYYYTPGEVLYDARYFYYTAFGERQFYIEGYEYTNTTEKNFDAIIQDKLKTMKLVYQNDAAAIQKLKHAGVEYLVRSEFASASFQLSPKYGKIVFANQDIIIYQLN